MRPAVTALLLAACGATAGAPADPCPSGICTASGDGGRGTDGAGAEAEAEGEAPDGPAARNDAGGPGCTRWRIPDEPSGVAVRDCEDEGAETSRPLPALSEPYFRCNVQPILGASCSMIGCHSERTPARGMRLYSRIFERLAPVLDGLHDDGPVDFDSCGGQNCDVDPLAVAEWAWNYDMARLFTLDATAAADAELISQPLAADGAGHGHAGFDLFAGPEDVRVQTLIAWINGATDTADCGGRLLPVPNVGRVADLDDYGCPRCRVAGRCTPGGAPDPERPCDPEW